MRVGPGPAWDRGWESNPGVSSPPAPAWLWPPRRAGVLFMAPQGHTVPKAPAPGPQARHPCGSSPTAHAATRVGSLVNSNGQPD